MFLSRVQVDTVNRQKVSRLTHLGAYHDWVEESFPNEIDQKVRLRHLWRIDRLAGKAYLLLLSPDKPDQQRLLRYGVPGTVQVKEYGNFIERLKIGQILQFRLTANPTRAVSVEGQRGQVRPQVTVSQQEDWLNRRAVRAGFIVSETSAGKDFRIVARDYPVLRREHGKQIRLSRVTFEGHLKITDLELFKTTLTTGLGREKAYGMGLLTVIPER